MTPERSNSGGRYRRSYTYDTMNRLVSGRYDDGTQFQYSYDAAGNRTGQSSGPQGAAPAQQPGSPSVCPACGAPRRPDAKFCRSCGTPLQPLAPEPPAVRVCRTCGNPLKPGKPFCSRCGTKVQ